MVEITSNPSFISPFEGEKFFSLSRKLVPFHAQDWALLQSQKPSIE